MKYVQVVEWSAGSDGIRLQMLGEDQQIHVFEVSAECAGVLAAALAAETQKLSSGPKDQQFLRPTALQTGKTDKGEPVMMISLDGGAELPLVFKLESLGAIISELEGLRRALQPGSQIRWQ